MAAQALDRPALDARYTELPEMAADGDEDAMRCGGCAAKVPADVLGRVMARLAAGDRATP